MLSERRQRNQESERRITDLGTVITSILWTRLRRRRALTRAERAMKMAPAPPAFITACLGRVAAIEDGRKKDHSPRGRETRETKHGLCTIPSHVYKKTHLPPLPDDVDDGVCHRAFVAPTADV